MRVLLLSPHADDVELGAGGLVCRLIEEGGHAFKWLVFSRCEDSLGAHMAPEILEQEFGACADFLGLKDREILDFAVRRMPDRRQEILEHLVRVKREFAPDVVVTPVPGDLHQDHETIAAEALRAFKSSATLIGYGSPWNNVDFRSTLIVRLTEKQVLRKWRALQHYRSQIELGRAYFSQELIMSWARMRGAACGAPFAEAFEIMRAVL